MLKLLFNHEFLNIKFMEASNKKVYVLNTKENKIYSLENYKKIYIFYHKKESYNAVLNCINIAENYDNYLAGTWKPAPAEGS